MGSRIQVLDNGTLIINTVNDKDSGDYLCVARNAMGDDFQLMKVYVAMKPARIEPKVYGKKQVPYGNDLRVDCKASGAPEPEISWGLPDGTLVNSALQSDSSGRGGRSKRFILFDNGTLYLNQVSQGRQLDQGSQEVMLETLHSSLPPNSSIVFEKTFFSKKILTERGS